MSRVDELEEQVLALSADELAELWTRMLDEQDRNNWNAELERDVRNGRLDALAEWALREHTTGKTTPL